MLKKPNSSLIKLDLNNPVFQKNWLDLEKPEKEQVAKALCKMRQLTWSQLYKGEGKKWEKISSIMVPEHIDALYSLKITQTCRAIAYRDKAYLRFLTIAAEHYKEPGQ